MSGASWWVAGDAGDAGDEDMKLFVFISIYYYSLLACCLLNCLFGCSNYSLLVRIFLFFIFYFLYFFIFVRLLFHPTDHQCFVRRSCK